MVLCAAPNCANRTPHFSMKRLPMNSQLRALWLKSFNNVTVKLDPYSHFCEVHFTQDQWVDKEKKKFKQNAIPSVFCLCPSQRPNVKRKPLMDTSNTSQDHSYTYKKPRLSPTKKGNALYGNENAYQETPKRKRGRPSKDAFIEHLTSCPMKRRNLMDHDYLDFSVCSPPSATTVPSAPAAISTPKIVNCDNSGPSICCDQNVEISADDQHLSTESVSTPNLFHSEKNLLGKESSNSVSTFCSDQQFEIAANDPHLKISPENHLQLASEETCCTTPLKNFNYEKIISELRKENKNLKEENTKLRQQITALRSNDAVQKSRLARAEEKLEKLIIHSSKRFQPDQLDALSRGGNLRGMAWSPKTIMTALKIHFACGTSGYGVVSTLQMPLPSMRVLQRALEHLHFRPGKLTELIPPLRTKVSTMTPMEVECMLAFDECSVKEAEEFDETTSTYIGHCTIPASKQKLSQQEKLALNNDPILMEAEITRRSTAALKQKANKAMLFVLGGVKQRWKQTIAYHFTSNSFDGVAVKEEIVEIIKMCHEVGLKVRVVVSDMGNRAVWNAFGLDVGPSCNRNWVPHPVMIGEKLYIIPDVVHLLKAIGMMLRKNKLIFLPVDIVQPYELPGNCVKLDHLSMLCKFQLSMRWKLAPGLNASVLNVNHFDKMKVSFHTRIFNPRVAAALIFMSTLPEGDPEMKTTAFFIMAVHKWFSIVSARNPVLGLSHKNPGAFTYAVDILQLTMHIFQNMRVGNEWKPCQTGVKSATQCLLELVELYVDRLGFDFLLGGRFTTDICENCFSVLRYGRRNMTSLQLKHRLRQCTVCQFNRHVSKSSYDLDDRQDLLDILKAEKVTPKHDTNDLFNTLEEEQEVILATLDAQAIMGGIENLSEFDKYVLYRVCGYVIKKLKDENQSFANCSTCFAVCLHNSTIPHRYSAFLRATNFKDGALLEVSDDVFNLLLIADEKIMAVQDKIRQSNFDLKIFLHKVCNFPFSPNSALRVTCQQHNLRYLILDRYIRMVLKMGSDKPSHLKDSKAASSQLSSRTMGSGYLARQLKS